MDTQTKAAHTPVEFSTSLYVQHMRRTTDGPITRVFIESETAPHVLADMLYDDTETDAERAEILAYANLFAASADLLAACRRFVEIGEHRWRALPADTPEKRLIADANDIIKRATR